MPQRLHDAAELAALFRRGAETLRRWADSEVASREQRDELLRLTDSLATSGALRLKGKPGQQAELLDFVMLLADPNKQRTWLAR